MKEKKGITLIALIITIITILILASVSINFIFGENGIINRVRSASEKSKIEEERERLVLALAEIKINNSVTDEKDNKGIEKIVNILDETGYKIGVIQDEADEDIYIATFEKTRHIFHINKKTGEVKFAGILNSEFADMELVEGDIIFSYDPSDWTNGSVKTTIKVKDSIDMSEFSLQYSKDSKVWEDYKQPILSTANEAIYARIKYIVTGQIKVYATGNVDKIDTTKPVARITSSNTNSITFTASDTKGTNENASGIVGYSLSTSQEIPNNWEDYTGESKTVGSLTQGTEYYLYVKDAAGNISEVQSATLGNVTGLQTEDIIFRYEPSDWTNLTTVDSVKVVATINETKNIDITGYTLRLTTDISTKPLTWEEADKGITRNTNGPVYALLVDSIGQIGKTYATGNVDKIDTTKPVASITNSDTNSITFTASDTKGTNENASGIVGYSLSTSQEIPNSWEDYTGESKTVGSLVQGTKYYLYVKDAAGNISEVKSATLGNVTSLKTEDVIFRYEPSDWTNLTTVNSVKVVATINETKNIDITGYTLRLTTDISTRPLTWEEADKGITRNTNGPVYALLVDSTGQIGTTYATGNVDKIDTTKPVASIASSNSNSITFTASDTKGTNENASGIVGYSLSTSQEIPNSWEDYTGESKTVGSLTPGTTYYLYVKDAAGNISDVKNATTSKQLVTSITLNKTSTTITKGNTTSLTPTINPSDAYNKSVTWSSSDTSIATVSSSGTVTGKAVGTVTITCTASDGSGKSATCKVIVSEVYNYAYTEDSSTEPVYNYSYTGSSQTVTLPAGTYKLEVWGAQGGGSAISGNTYSGSGAKGGYSVGVLNLTSSKTLYVYVGGYGKSSTSGSASGGFNGGGSRICF